MTAYMARAQREDWRTPVEFVSLVREALGEIDLDPCCSMLPDAEPIARLGLGGPAGSDTDGLAAGWGPVTVYVNPPFGSLWAWVKKCAEEAEDGAEIVVLLPARTDTIGWHKYVPTASAVCLWRGRIKFVGAKTGAPFPVAVVYWGARVRRFREVFGPHGMVFRP